jgi:hypothetical protein
MRCLGTIKSSLCLDGCSSVVDVSALGRIPCLTLEDCSEIRDISQLSDNMKLTILNCARIQVNMRKMETQATRRKLEFLAVDMLESSQQLHSFFQSSQPSSLRELVLKRYSNLCIDASFISNVSILRLNYIDDYVRRSDNEDEDEDGEEMSGMRTRLGIDCSQLANLFRITLESFPIFNLDLSSLYHVPVVELISLPIKTLQGLGGNKVLYLSGCERVEDFSATRNIL